MVLNGAEWYSWTVWSVAGGAVFYDETADFQVMDWVRYAALLVDWVYPSRAVGWLVLVPVPVPTTIGLGLLSFTQDSFRLFILFCLTQPWFV
jgi:hypothetical protein